MVSKASAAHQISGKAAKPMAALIVLALDTIETSLLELARERGKSLAANIGGGELRCNSFQHPRTAEVQAGQVIEFTIGHITNVGGLQVHGWKKRSEPTGELFLR